MSSLPDTPYGADDAPAMPSQPTFYRLVKRLAEGRHTFGSARTRRSLSKQPDGPFGAITVVRPGEMVEIDSSPLDCGVAANDQNGRCVATVGAGVDARTDASGLG